MPKYLPITAACISTGIGGLVAVYTRLLVQGYDPVSLGVLRYGIALICLLTGVLFVRDRFIKRVDRVPMALIGILFFSFFPIGFSVALKYTTAAQGALVFSVMPIITIILAGLARREKITLMKLFGSFLVFFGVASVVDLDFQGKGETFFGNLIMFCMAFLGAVFNVLARPYLQKYNKLIATTWFMLWGWLGMVAVLISSSELNFYIPPPDIWLIIILLGSLGGALPIFLFNWALGNIESTKVAVSIGFNPLVAALAGIFVLSEAVNAAMFFGLAMVVFGVLAANWSSR